MTQWIRWHMAELVAVTLTAVAGLAVSWWLLLLTALVTAVWARHEVANRPEPCPALPERRRELVPADLTA